MLDVSAPIISLSGSNLYTITDYSGFDPEVSMNGEDFSFAPGSNNWTRNVDFTTHPLPRKWTLTLKFNL
jgi:hypothetical protein